MEDALSDRGERRPYRVEFIPGRRTDPVRRGVIVARNEETAHREARSIAAAGGHAKVLQVGAEGHRWVLAVYPPEGGGAEGQ